MTSEFPFDRPFVMRKRVLEPFQVESCQGELMVFDCADCGGAMEHWTPSFMDGRDTWLLADLYVNKALIGEDELLRHGACRQGTKRPVADGLREQNTVMQYVEHGTFALLYRRLTCPECGQNHILVHACGEIGMGCTVTFVNGIWGVDVLPSR